MNFHTLKLPQALAITALIFIADQVSKWFVVEQIIKPLALPDRTDPSAMPFIAWLLHARDPMPFAQDQILPFFNLVMVWNKGVSFGIFNNHGASGPLLLTILAIAIVTMFLIWMVRSPSGLVRLSIAMIIGGALGNVVDRLRFGAVADFLDFHLGNLHWPAFNLADSTICLGIAMLLIHSLFFDTQKKQAASQ
ncbi:MAG: Lipoprotein signal peptidase [Micavibrio sp.]|nr:Lipoprotein signal peptidase [Micavibrio sp.]